MTTATKISEQFGNDGQCWEDSQGHSLECACNDVGQRSSRGTDVRWEFADGSAIIACGRAWDVRHSLCTCGWCWEARPSKVPPCAENADRA